MVTWIWHQIEESQKEQVVKGSLSFFPDLKYQELHILIQEFHILMPDHTMIIPGFEVWIPESNIPTTDLTMTNILKQTFKIQKHLLPILEQ